MGWDGNLFPIFSFALRRPTLSWQSQWWTLSSGIGLFHHIYQHVSVLVLIYSVRNCTNRNSTASSCSTCNMLKNSNRMILGFCDNLTHAGTGSFRLSFLKKENTLIQFNQIYTSNPLYKPCNKFVGEHRSSPSALFEHLGLQLLHRLSFELCYLFFLTIRTFLLQTC